MMTYKIRYWRDGDRWVAEAIGLPGGIAVGDTPEAAVAALEKIIPTKDQEADDWLSNPDKWLSEHDHKPDAMKRLMWSYAEALAWIASRDPEMVQEMGRRENGHDAELCEVFSHPELAGNIRQAEAEFWGELQAGNILIKAINADPRSATLCVVDATDLDALSIGEADDKTPAIVRGLDVLFVGLRFNKDNILARWPEKQATHRKISTTAKHDKWVEEARGIARGRNPPLRPDGEFNVSEVARMVAQGCETTVKPKTILRVLHARKQGWQ